MMIKVQNLDIRPTVVANDQGGEEEINRPTSEVNGDSEINTEVLITQIRYVHSDERLHASLSFESDCAVWVIEFYRDHVMTSSALYLSEATAILMLKSMGYQQDLRAAC